MSDDANEATVSRALEVARALKLRLLFSTDTLFLLYFGRDAEGVYVYCIYNGQGKVVHTTFDEDALAAQSRAFRWARTRKTPRKLMWMH